MKLTGKLIVSCQATEGDAFRDSLSMGRFARAAVAGGAAAIRANGPADVRAIRKEVSVPIIGIQKTMMEDGRILITHSLESARALVLAGADMIAIDCTRRGQQFGGLERIREIHTELGLPVLADIATVEEAIAAADAGADYILSTMRGYTDDTAHVTAFEPAFIAALVKAVSVPVIAEGRIHRPEQARQAIAAGAIAVIVGTAITRPQDITRRFAGAIEREYSLQREVRYFACVDLGGTNTKYGLVSNNGQFVFRSFCPTPAAKGRDELLNHLINVVREIAAHAACDGFSIGAIGIASAGWISAATGEVAYATDNLPGWTGTPIAATLEKEFAVPVAVENDANALALAEKRFGAAKSMNDFVCITLGTGVGGGCYVGGKLNRGAHSFGNAIGHMSIDANGTRCNCGQRGCLEVYTNAVALLRYAGAGFRSAEDVIAAANSGVLEAIQAVRTVAIYLARGCAILTHLLDPEAFILSGGLTENNPLLVSGLTEELGRLVSVWDKRRVRTLASELGYYGGVLGAAAVASSSKITFSKECP